MENSKFISSLEDKIKGAYEQGVTMEEAEKLAAEFLHAQLKISASLRSVDLDARMRKTGLKAVKAGVYMEVATSADKKPTEAYITATIDKHTVVQQEQDGLDAAEVDKAELERLYETFGNAHVFFRNIAKGNFGG